MTQIAGVVLCGGRSSRMGGGEKALLDLSGKTLAARAVERLAGQVSHVAISANDQIHAYSNICAPVLRDEIHRRAGPLAGILSALHWGASIGAADVVSVAGDTPFFPSDLVSRLEAGRGSAKIAIARTPEENIKFARHPTFGLWAVDLADDLEAALGQGTRKILHWAEQHGFADVMFEDAPFNPFFNANTPEDMAHARALVTEYDL